MGIIVGEFDFISIFDLCNRFIFSKFRAGRDTAFLLLYLLVLLVHNNRGVIANATPYCLGSLTGKKHTEGKPSGVGGYAVNDRTYTKKNPI